MGSPGTVSTNQDLTVKGCGIKLAERQVKDLLVISSG